VIRDPAVWRRTLEEVASAFVAEGAAMIGAMVSPLTGADGNVEFLAHLRAHGAPASAAAAPALDVAAVVAGAVALYGDPALGGRSGPDR
jgi:23S rRNA (cytidine1920-2'-O)/16S rRNA (cytidine1409-2'-O)-methyltransferase